MSIDNFLCINCCLYFPIIYNASYFAEKEADWVILINNTEKCFWADALTFTYYSANEITNMHLSTSSNATGYEITASWDDYKNLKAGSRSEELTYTDDGILLKYEEKHHWNEKDDWQLTLEKADSNNIPAFPFVIFSICSIFGIIFILRKKREIYFSR
ncbi:MAG: hypothetical protein ACTSVL_04230 [Promethearchaeota archaeon]